MPWRLETPHGEDDASATAAALRSSCPPGDGAVTPWRVTDDGGGRRVLYAYLPPRLCAALLAPPPARRAAPESESSAATALRIVLAIHGYGGRAVQEVKKWHGAAASLGAVVLAPEGTRTTATHKLGWNAVECCGDPVTDEIDDVDFLVNGVVGVFVDAIRRGRGGADVVDLRNIHMIATGFSNGGFLTSLLGLQSAAARLPWLVGIAPMGGYQYAEALYRSPRPPPLAVMAHHGGRDSVVRPEGCCAPTNRSESNCYFDIGIQQTTCTSVQSAFEMWSDINGCSATVLDMDVVNDKLAKSKPNKEPTVTCWKGLKCLQPTNLCIWNQEGHAWGAQFPGMKMAEIWFEEVFLSAETRGTIPGNRGDGKVGAPYTPTVFSSPQSKKGRLFFSATVIALGLCVLCVLSWTRRAAPRCLGDGSVLKQKSSEEENERDSDSDGNSDSIPCTQMVSLAPSSELDSASKQRRVGLL